MVRLPHFIRCARSSPRNLATAGPQDGWTSDPFVGIALGSPLSIGRMLIRHVTALTEETWISESRPAICRAAFAAACLDGKSITVEAAAICLRMSRRFHRLSMSLQWFHLQPFFSAAFSSTAPS